MRYKARGLCPGRWHAAIKKVGCPSWASRACSVPRGSGESITLQVRRLELLASGDLETPFKFHSFLQHPWRMCRCRTHLEASSIRKGRHKPNHCGAGWEARMCQRRDPGHCKGERSGSHRRRRLVGGSWVGRQPKQIRWVESCFFSRSKKLSSTCSSFYLLHKDLGVPVNREGPAFREISM